MSSETLESNKRSRTSSPLDDRPQKWIKSATSGHINGDIYAAGHTTSQLATPDDTKRALQNVENAADQIFSNLSSSSAEQLAEVIEDEANEYKEHWRDWHVMLYHGAKRTGILDTHGRFTSQVLKDMHRKHLRRKVVLGLALSWLVCNDQDGLVTLREVGSEVFSTQGNVTEHWETALIDATQKLSNDDPDLMSTLECVKSHVPAVMGHIAFVEFMQRQEEAMRFALEPFDDQAADASSHGGSQTSDIVRATPGAPSELSLHQPTPLPLDQPPTGLDDSTSPSSAPATLRESYDKARLTAHNRSIQKKRPPSPAPTSNRKVWSIDEENALLEGLEYVKGPHWRDILSLYGEHGTRSEVLKSRSQVQLKDKARNLKLFFVKNGMEVPQILKNVTGELRKGRGGAGGEKEGDVGEQGVEDATNANEQPEQRIEAPIAEMQAEEGSLEEAFTAASDTNALMELAPTIAT